jgi:hypothetical protein
MFPLDVVLVSGRPDGVQAGMADASMGTPEKDPEDWVAPHGHQRRE